MNIQKLVKQWKQLDTMVLVYTAIIFFNHMSYGICINMLGPTLVDMQYVFNTPVDSMLYLSSLVAIGYMFGSFVCWTYTWINRQLALAFFVAIMTIGYASLPFCGYVWILYTATFAFGVGTGAWDASISVWLVDMWTTKSSAFLQGSQFAYGMGTFIGPTIVSSFVAGEEKNNTFENGRNVTIHVSGEDRQRHLAVPFAITGVLLGITPVLLLIFYFLNPFKPGQDDQLVKNVNKVELAKEQEEEGVPISSVSYRWLKLALVATCLGTYGSVENNFMNYWSPVLQYLPIQWSAQWAAWLTALMSITYSIGRLATAFISLRLSPDVILVYHFAIIIVSMIVLYIASVASIAWLFFVGSACIGFGFSAVWPAIFSYTEYHLRLTNQASAVFSVATGVLTFVSPLLLSSRIKDTPLVLFYVSSGFLVLCLSMFISVKLFVYFTPNKKVQYQ